MKFLIIVSYFLYLIKFASAQNYCDVERFDQAIFDSVDLEIIANIKYGDAINNLGIAQDLYLDIYRPNPDLDTMIKKPLIMFVHGGGLVGGDKNSMGSVDLGYLYARAGFVYATINYRLGWIMVSRKMVAVEIQLICLKQHTEQCKMCGRHCVI